MDFATLERKVRRLFGDEHDIVIQQIDIIDWVNAASVDIARTTLCLPFDVMKVANEFPITIDDMIAMYRVVYGSPWTPKTFTTLEQIDAEAITFGPLSVGTPQRYYLQANKLYLYPFPQASDITEVTVTYNRMPRTITGTALDPLDLPISYHEDLVRYCLARAYEKNENYEAQSRSEELYMTGMNQRVWEKNQADESFPFVRPDPMDYV